MTEEELGRLAQPQRNPAAFRIDAFHAQTRQHALPLPSGLPIRAIAEAQHVAFVMASDPTEQIVGLEPVAIGGRVRELLAQIQYLHLHRRRITSRPFEIHILQPGFSRHRGIYSRKNDSCACSIYVFIITISNDVLYCRNALNTYSSFHALFCTIHSFGYSNG